MSFTCLNIYSQQIVCELYAKTKYLDRFVNANPCLMIKKLAIFMSYIKVF